MTWNVSPIRRGGVDTLWPTVLPLLEPALEYSGGRIDARSVLDWLHDGRYLLWVAHQDDMEIAAAFVTREANYPCKRMLTIDLAGGTNLDGWVEEADRVFRTHSHEVGLAGVEIYGRLGWVRALKRLGWQQTAAIVETSI
jgi:hypothetical protein